MLLQEADRIDYNMTLEGRDLQKLCNDGFDKFNIKPIKPIGVSFYHFGVLYVIFNYPMPYLSLLVTKITSIYIVKISVIFSCKSHKLSLCKTSYDDWTKMFFWV